jgi:hypothetical protein
MESVLQEVRSIAVRELQAGYWWKEVCGELDRQRESASLEKDDLKGDLLPSTASKVILCALYQPLYYNEKWGWGGNVALACLIFGLPILMKLGRGVFFFPVFAQRRF